MPASSLYCCHRSVSMISAAAKNRRIAASPRVRPPLARAGGASVSSRPAPRVAAPTAAPFAKKERRLVRYSDCSTVSMISSFPGPLSGAEVRDRRGTADALNPDVLDPGDVGCNVVGGDDHLRGEGLVVTVARAVEVCIKPDRVLIGGCGLQGLRRRPRALEGRAPPEVDRVPANAFAREAAGQRALTDRARAAKAARRVH